MMGPAHDLRGLLLYASRQAEPQPDLLAPMLLNPLDLIIGGLVVGGIYALIAIGLNLQYGVSRVLNLAYGEALMLGGYAAFFGFTQLHLPPLVTALFGVPVVFAIGWLLFRFVLHPLLSRTGDPGKREVDSILSTFGLLFLL